MCGRFSRNVGLDVIQHRYRIDRTELSSQYTKSFNVAPQQQVPVIYRENPLVLKDMQWGLIPSTYKSINARSETIFEKATFARILDNRCLIPVTGFYEWKEEKIGKIPYHISVMGEEIFSFAGLYTSNQGKESFTILTCEPNTHMTPIHDRMPVILDREGERLWLDPELTHHQIAELVVPYSKPMVSYPVSKFVNDPANNNEQCLVEYKPLRSPQRTLDDFF